jgi:DNA-binding Lrp family transcriptional regulator
MDKTPLDSKDFGLINALQQNASRRLEDLAQLVHLSPSSVHDRLRRLEKAGIIRDWTVRVDAAAMGLGVMAFVGVRATKPCSELIPALREIPCIEECHSVAGGLSIILKVRSWNSQIVYEKFPASNKPKQRSCSKPTSSAQSSSPNRQHHLQLDRRNRFAASRGLSSS